MTHLGTEKVGPTTNCQLSVHLVKGATRQNKSWEIVLWDRQTMSKISLRLNLSGPGKVEAVQGIHSSIHPQWQDHPLFPPIWDMPQIQWKNWKYSILSRIWRERKKGFAVWLTRDTNLVSLPIDPAVEYLHYYLFSLTFSILLLCHDFKYWFSSGSRISLME